MMKSLRQDFWSTRHLYLVLDTSVQAPDELLETAKEAVRFGVDVVQLRDKSGSSRAYFELTGRLREALSGQVPVIVNDRLDIALAAGADGVHLGQDDLPLPNARRIAGPTFWIGQSCQELDHVRAAQAAGADYIGFGSVFATRTKPERSPMDLSLLRRAAEMAEIPLFAIGGITTDNVDEVLKSGISRVAVTRSISLARPVSGAVRAFRQKLDVLSRVN